MAVLPPPRQSSAATVVADTPSIDASHCRARLPLRRLPPRPAMVTPSPIVAHTLPQVVAPISHPSSPLLASPLISTQPCTQPLQLSQPMVAQERQVLSSSTSRGKRKASTEKQRKAPTAKRRKSPIVQIVRSPGIRIMISPMLRPRYPSSEEAVELGQSSTVPSESTFSTGSRVISDYRSSLTSETVEILMCLEDWIRAEDATILDSTETDSGEDNSFSLQNFKTFFTLGAAISPCSHDI